MVLALLLGAVYALSALGKSRDLRGLEDYVRPVAGGASRRLARLLPAGEAVLAVGLASAIVSASVAPAAGAASALFLVTASAFQAVLLARSQPSRCHCFGNLPSTSTRIDPAWRPALFALRNGALAAASASVAGATPVATAAASGVVATTIAAGLLASTLRAHLDLRKDSNPLADSLAPQILNLQAHSWWVNGHPRAF